MIEEAKRKEIADWVLQADDKMILLIEQLMKSETSDWWDELTDSQKKRIQKGYDSVLGGKSIPHEEVAEKYGLQH